jgi:hypothetical protein
MPHPTQSSETSEQPSSNFNLILVTEFDAPQLFIFNTAEEVAACIRDYRKTMKKFYTFVFEGQQWKTTAGRRNYLLSPESDERIPLFEEEPEIISEDGVISN